MPTTNSQQSDELDKILEQVQDQELAVDQVEAKIEALLEQARVEAIKQFAESEFADPYEYIKATLQSKQSPNK